MKTNAQRQAEFRARQKERLTALPPVVAPPPALDNIPAERRWSQLQEQASRLLEQARDEMQVYYEARSEQWQESDKGESFKDRIDSLEQLISDLAAVSQL